MDERVRCRVAILAFADAHYDARTLNICRTLASECDVILWNTVPGSSVGWQWRAVVVRRSGRMIVRWARFITKLAWRALRTKVDVVWAADVYSLLPAVVFRWRWKARVVYDAREIYSSLGSLAERPHAQRLLAWYERTLIRWVDRVVTSGNRDAEELTALLQLRTPPVVVLNIPFYTNSIRSNKLREHCQIGQDAIIVLYQGALHAGRGLLRAVEAIAQVDAAHLCILGDGELAGAIQYHAQLHGVTDRVHLLGSVPYDELLRWTSSADIGWSWIEPITHSYELALPNKLFEYAMARIPVLASDLPAMREVLDAYPFGLCCPTTATARELAKAILLLHAHAAEYRIYAERAAREFCYERQQSKIRILINELWKRQ